MKLINKKNGNFSIDKFIPIILGVFVFLGLIGTVANSVSTVVSPHNATSNVSGGAIILLGLTTLILVIGFIMSIYKSK